MVTGTDEDDLKDAADRGKEVADAIHSALTRTGGLAALDSTFDPTTHTATATVGKLVMGPSDAQGMTWAEVGTGLVDMRIGDGATGTTKGRYGQVPWPA